MKPILGGGGKLRGKRNKREAAAARQWNRETFDWNRAILYSEAPADMDAAMVAWLEESETDGPTAERA